MFPILLLSADLQRYNFLIHPFESALAIKTPSNQRSMLRTDPIEKLIVSGINVRPSESDKVGADTWEKITVNKEGYFEGSPALNGGYVYVNFKSPKDQIMMLGAKGSSISYVNGVPRGGDPYQYGYMNVPVKLKAGSNDFLFACGRGRFSASLTKLGGSPLTISSEDATLPDITPAVKGNLDGAVVVINETEKKIQNVQIKAESEDGTSITISNGSIEPLTIRKLRFQTNGKSEKVKLTVLTNDLYDVSQTVTLRRRKLGETYKRTFISAQDGSVQYYAVNPSSDPRAGQALFLSLHGASVEAINQADAYASKNWGTVVAATNRRPFGFDWEDVGRRDALEVLAHAKKDLKPDNQKIYLTGHSMGGHGTWQIGAHFPDQFASIAPSAGWTSFWSYAGGKSYDLKDPIQAMLRRATNASDTLELKENYKQQSIYILHGDADDNVPVSEARNMRKELADHPSLFWFEQKGAGHWWSEGNDPGALCVDFPGFFELFGKSQIPKSADVKRVNFTTANPGVSASNHWVTIQQQVRPWEFSNVDGTANLERQSFEGTTKNVRHLTLRCAPFSSSADVTISLDGSPSFKMPWSKNGVIDLVNVEGTWKATSLVSLKEKNPMRYGGWKDIYRNQVMFVYGTAGNQVENDWARNKARYDAETFYYRGNSSVDVMSDIEFLKHNTKDRNVVLYGNSSTNAAFKKTLNLPDITLKNGEFKVGKKAQTGDHLAVLLIGPRHNSNIASVAVVGGTGIEGSRLTDRCPFFTAGAGIPDCIAFDPTLLNGGSKGIKVAGFFGNKWDVESGDFVWNL
jgi:poly(3-hydroxybutyrate) depolymerase